MPAVDDVKRALRASTVYFLIIFALGFVLGTIRVLFVAPRLGELAATAAELPFMLTAAWFICCWAIDRWHVPSDAIVHWAMALWFLALLTVFEMSLGAILFDRSPDEQWAALSTPAGYLGLSAQIIPAALPLWLGRGRSQ